jgi:CRISPR system Cascade subunit CasC
VSPGAKLGSTAPHSYASLVLGEAGEEQPRTLANAFLDPVRVTSRSSGLLRGSYEALACHLRDLDRTYGPYGARKYSALGATEGLQAVLGDAAPLDEVARWAGSIARGG